MYGKFDSGEVPELLVCKGFGGLLHRCNCGLENRHSLNTGTIESITTLEPSTSSIVIHKISITKERRIVHLCLYFDVVNNLIEKDDIFLLPEGWRPENSFYTTGIIYAGSPQNERYPYVVIQKDGKICGNIKASQTVFIDTTYIQGF